MDTSLYGLHRLPDVAIVINHSSNSTSHLPGVKEVRSDHMMCTYMAASQGGVQEGKYVSSLLPSWCIGSCVQSSKFISITIYGSFCAPLHFHEIVCH